ncbi:two-component sensor histidine kinase [Streptomyces venezuelae]|uniref:histidine kinase n=1 Tax=Streptomyces venezuelae TaxID=54571 RepID=A0A5P2CZ82_STRVZ|nr:histidine kinase [Streptomyces venezuelae]QES48206.1 two-component sensor histidine kinase [Streptomyces venezuelae]
MPLFRPHPHDVLLCVISVLAGLVLWSLGLYTTTFRDLLPAWAALVPLAVMGVVELFRRTAPQPALLIGTAALIADQLTVGNLATVFMFTDVMYAAVVYGHPAMARRLPIVTGVITVVATLLSVALLRTPESVLIGVVTGIVCFGPALTGASVRYHREAADAARLRAEQTALLAEMDRKAAIVAERARMARELHDMVANHLSAIAIHSTAALSIDSADTSREALGVIRENSVQGLSEMRRLIGLLRQAGAEQEPVAVPSLDGLAALLDQARATGAASGLEFVLEDTRPAGGEPLPAPVELAAYRIVQESVTNALKHAAPGPVRVLIGRSGALLTVRVDSPYGDRPGPRAPGSGAGLVGMRERTELLGGEFAAGPAEPVGAAGATGTVWQVRAVLPAEEKAVEA